MIRPAIKKMIIITYNNKLEKNIECNCDINVSGVTDQLKATNELSGEFLSSANLIILSSLLQIKNTH